MYYWQRVYDKCRTGFAVCRNMGAKQMSSLSLYTALLAMAVYTCTGFAERITSYRCISHKVYFTGSCTKNFSLYIHLNCENTCNFQQNLHLIPLPLSPFFYSFLPCGVRIKCPCTCTGFELSTKCVNRCI